MYNNSSMTWCLLQEQILWNTGWSSNDDVWGDPDIGISDDNVPHCALCHNIPSCANRNIIWHNSGSLLAVENRYCPLIGRHDPIVIECAICQQDAMTWLDFCSEAQSPDIGQLSSSATRPPRSQALILNMPTVKQMWPSPILFLFKQVWKFPWLRIIPDHLHSRK